MLFLQFSLHFSLNLELGWTVLTHSLDICLKQGLSSKYYPIKETERTSFILKFFIFFNFQAMIAYNEDQKNQFPDISNYSFISFFANKFYE